ncbi:tetratricopeptide repeat protein [Oceaniglobus ichthyenteri]|uniref:tetratricopeptide repeat protein n=1 Tax=Oceaniglobus ichthyenteri TaxID=2136177 RepID=UPI0013DE410E|nr:SEL1-like repeat protein [Oceaniglobus ichthyenteri]
MPEGHIQSPPNRRLSGLRCVLVACFALGSPVQAQDTLDLQFRPPAITPGPICESPPTDDETTDFWGDWDQRVLPDRPMRSIRRDMNRLVQIDGARWFDTVTRAMDLLEKSDPVFEGETALVMRIAVLDGAGKFEDLTTSGLVAQLAAQIDDLKPASKLVLSRYLRNGIGIAADSAMADRLLVDAGYAGDPKALLALAALQLAGKAPADWSVPAELAVATAFSTMVGELDPQICDRATRIATQFRLGGVVTPDPQLAHDWYRFTADLGSGHAAWKVVEYHMRAEQFEKTNDLLLRYLEMAASADLSYAQIELARVLERGALAPRNIDRAYALYEAASRSGDLRGLSQFALFLRRHEPADPTVRAPRVTVLQKLTARNDAPGWAFSQLAETTLEDRGVWAGAGDARPLLEQAVKRGNLDGHVMLAQLILANSPNAANIDRAVDLLAHVVNERGGSQPMKMIRAAHVCRANGAPDRAAAQYWLAEEQAIGVSDSDDHSSPLLSLTIADNAPRLAEIQSFALSGSPNGLAMWRRVIKAAPFADEAMRNFWANYFDQTDARLVAQAKLDLTLTRDPGVHAVIFAALRERHATSGPNFAGWLNDTLVSGMYGPEILAQLSTEARTAATIELTRSSAMGYGRAMIGLAALANTPADRSAIFDRFRAVIDANGDYAAQLFAARHGDRPGYYAARAAGIMPCSFRSAMEMAALGGDLGNTAQEDHWLAVADVLAPERTSWMIALARAYLRGGKAEMGPRAMDLLTEASAQGDINADVEIFRLIVTPGGPSYDPDRAARIIASALEGGQMTVLSRYLSAHRNADQATRTRIEALLDMPMIYRSAAEAGDAVAMRIHGLVLREQAAGAADLTAAMGWLARAAKAGDTTAMTELGEALAFGIGLPADRDRALIWLTRAAEQGSDKAREITRLVGLSE